MSAIALKMQSRQIRQHLGSGYLSSYDNTRIIIGIEGGETYHTLTSYLLEQYTDVHEVNSLFTKQRRMLSYPQS